MQDSGRLGIVRSDALGALSSALTTFTCMSDGVR